ncbi:MAG: hypothetical protein MZW92_10045 [Comamonadaceae bacterium]|nr:hypothetical protein [Comamonadaceae bacterium]
MILDYVTKEYLDEDDDRRHDARREHAAHLGRHRRLLLAWSRLKRFLEKKYAIQHPRRRGHARRPSTRSTSIIALVEQAPGEEGA